MEIDQPVLLLPGFAPAFRPRSARDLERVSNQSAYGKEESEIRPGCNKKELETHGRVNESKVIIKYFPEFTEASARGAHKAGND